MAFISISSNSRDGDYEKVKADIDKKILAAKKYTKTETVSYRYENGEEKIDESVDLMLYQSITEETSSVPQVPWFLDFHYTISGSTVEKVYSDELIHDFIEPGLISAEEFEKRFWGIELAVVNTDFLKSNGYLIYNRNSDNQHVQVRKVDLKRDLFVHPDVLPPGITRFNSNWVGKNFILTDSLIVFSESNKLFPTATPDEYESGLFVYIGGNSRTITTKNSLARVTIGALYKITLAEYETYKII